MRHLVTCLLYLGLYKARIKSPRSGCAHEPRLLGDWSFYDMTNLRACVTVSVLIHSKVGMLRLKKRTNPARVMPFTSLFSTKVIQINLTLAPPESQLGKWVRRKRVPKLIHPWRLLGTKLNVIFKQNDQKSNLDFVGGKESSRASVLAVAESIMVAARRHHVSQILLARVLAHPDKAVRIPFVGVFVVAWVLQIRRRDANLFAFCKRGAV